MDGPSRNWRFRFHADGPQRAAGEPDVRRDQALCRESITHGLKTPHHRKPGFHDKPFRHRACDRQTGLLCQSQNV